MNEDSKVTATCKWCGTSIPPTHMGPCPKCGKKGKKITAEVKKTIGLNTSLNWKCRREFYDKNPKIKWLIIAITIGSSFIGLIFSGPVGVIIGLLVGGFLNFIVPPAVTKVREIERGSS